MSRVTSATLVGVDGVAVEVEVRIGSQLPRIDVVGLPEAAVREAGARVRAAIGASGEAFPGRQVIVNLAPAALRKGGSSLDLPIAVGILAEGGGLDPRRLAGLGLVGELALDGRIRPVRGALALALAMRDAGCRRAVVPCESAREAALAPGLEVRAAPDLASLLRALRGEAALARVESALPEDGADAALDLADVRGQESAKRALEVAAAGGHALLLRGPPGAGKTMLARRLPGLLPALSPDEALEVTRIHGAAWLPGEAGGGRPLLSRRRPFRAPHHSASRAGILGGGSPPRPGEVSLAHRGVLLLDELPEFDRGVLESLRQVLEDRSVVLARAHGSSLFPADFQLVASANPCPCGFRLSGVRECRCDEGAIARYAARVSGPLLDRIDLHVDVPPVRFRDLARRTSGPASGEVRARVAAARERQAKRLAGVRGASGPTNAAIPAAAIDALAPASAEARELLARAVDRFGLSARAAHRVLRVARTIADLAGEPLVHAPALAEALGYRKAELA